MCQQGVTIVEVVIAMVMFVICILAIGFFSIDVIPTQRAYKADAIQQDALKLSYLLKNDIKNSFEIKAPAPPTDDSAVIHLTTLDLITHNKADLLSPIRAIYFIQSGQISRCISEDPEIACEPSDAIPLLSSWGNGMVSAVDGTRFVRGVNADDRIGLTAREKNFIRVELVLGQYEGPYEEIDPEKDTPLFTRTFFIETLSNVDSSRMVN